MPVPSQTPELYFAIILNGLRSPGVVALTGHDREWGWDVKDAKGQDGASTSRNGEKVAQFTATFSLSDDPLLDVDDFVGWETFQRMLMAAMRAKAPVAMPIQHPDLASQGITSVVVAGIGGLVHDGKGGATVAVKFLEYRPPKKRAVAKPKAGTSGKSGSNGTGHKVDPNAAAKADLEALVAESKKP